MSGLLGPWKMLDLAPTEDIRAIRRAYAVRLKAIDPDTDPQAFRALREAFEQAQREAEWIGQEDEEEDWVDWEETASASALKPAPFAELATDATPPPAPASPWATPDYDAHARALAELLLGDHPDIWPSAEEIAAMEHHWAAVCADPRMEEMDFFADAEQWAAGLLARSIPFSDPLIRPVSERFGWMAHAGTITQSDTVAQVVRRARMLDFLDLLRDETHPLHGAYIELTTPAQEGSKRGRVRRAQINALLERVRSEYPELESHFDSYRVSLWEGPGTGQAIGAWAVRILWVVGMLFLMRTCVYREQGKPPPEPVPVVESMTSDERADSTKAIDRLFNKELRLAEIEKNPSLRALVVQQWKQSRAEHRSLDGYRRDLARAFSERYQLVYRSAPLAVRAELHTLTLDEMKWLYSRDAAGCANYLQGKGETPEFPPALKTRRTELIARTLLETRDGLPRRREASDSFSVSGAIVAKAAKHAGMDREAFGATMRLEGPPERICKGRIALLETVLAMPRNEVAELLRKM